MFKEKHKKKCVRKLSCRLKTSAAAVERTQLNEKEIENTNEGKKKSARHIMIKNDCDEKENFVKLLR